MKKLVIIDGSSLACRAYFVVSLKWKDELSEIRDLLKNQETKKASIIQEIVYPELIEATKSLYKKFLKDILKREKQTHNLVAWDAQSGSKTFRGDLYPAYKGTRDSKLFPNELFTELEKESKELGYFNSKIVGFEADDILGTVAEMSKGQNFETIIISGDKDLLQLVNDSENITVQLPKTGVKVFKEMTELEIEAEYGISVEKLIDFKALVGDTSDNYPGVKGIGPKSAATLLNKYGSIDGIYKNISELTKAQASKFEDNKDTAYLFQTIAKIVTDIDVPFTLDEIER